MRYRREFEVQAPIDQVAAFHAKAASMAAITPPPIRVRFHQTPERLSDGDVIDFTLWVGPLPVFWSARIEKESPTEFVDHQLEGPFGSWAHRHRFVSVQLNRTKVIDEIEATYGHTFWQQLVGRAMWIGLPLLFAYRAWRTRRLLAGCQSGQHPADH